MNTQKTLALFDLDHTLLDIDSDYTWGEYIVKKGLVDEAKYRQANEAFYHQYIAGTLDATEYNEFVASFLTTKTMDELLALRADFIETEVKPHIRPKAVDAIAKHINNGDEVVIISATNDFVVGGIAKAFGIDRANVLATPLEVKDNRYTGKLTDKPNFQAGKIYHLNKWLEAKKQQGVVFDKSYGYSDSKNDIPLLEWADVAICVTPDDVLKEKAEQVGWQVMDWSL
ncbi:HAD family hydrolase [Psychrobacter sp. HD31]|uniref:HAD family hydrolase n=1 Tax=Psychrobacter sp. HD31 TaxID=3112003 RepID=UPI003DA2B8CB